MKNAQKLCQNVSTRMRAILRLVPVCKKWDTAMVVHLLKQNAIGRFSISAMWQLLLGMKEETLSSGRTCYPRRLVVKQNLCLVSKNYSSIKHVCMQIYAKCVHKGQLRWLDTLELKLHVVVSCSMWVLGTKHRFFKGPFNHWAISAAPWLMENYPQ